MMLKEARNERGTKDGKGHKETMVGGGEEKRRRNITGKWGHWRRGKRLWEKEDMIWRGGDTPYNGKEEVYVGTEHWLVSLAQDTFPVWFYQDDPVPDLQTNTNNLKTQSHTTCIE